MQFGVPRCTARSRYFEVALMTVWASLEHCIALKAMCLVIHPLGEALVTASMAHHLHTIGSVTMCWGCWGCWSRHTCAGIRRSAASCHFGKVSGSVRHARSSTTAIPWLLAARSRLEDGVTLQAMGLVIHPLRERLVTAHGANNLHSVDLIWMSWRNWMSWRDWR